MNVMFDKAAYEKGRSLKTTENNDVMTPEELERLDGEVVMKALLDSLASGKVGALSVDPNYLDFEALKCNY